MAKKTRTKKTTKFQNRQPILFLPPSATSNLTIEHTTMKRKNKKLMSRFLCKQYWERWRTIRSHPQHIHIQYYTSVNEFAAKKAQYSIYHDQRIANNIGKIKNMIPHSSFIVVVICLLLVSLAAKFYDFTFSIFKESSILYAVCTGTAK